MSGRGLPFAGIDRPAVRRCEAGLWRWRRGLGALGTSFGRGRFVSAGADDDGASLAGAVLCRLRLRAAARWTFCSSQAAIPGMTARIDVRPACSGSRGRSGFSGGVAGGLVGKFRSWSEKSGAAPLPAFVGRPAWIGRSVDIRTRRAAEGFARPLHAARG